MYVWDLLAWDYDWSQYATTEFALSMAVGCAITSVICILWLLWKGDKTSGGKGMTKAERRLYVRKTIEDAFSNALDELEEAKSITFDEAFYWRKVLSFRAALSGLRPRSAKPVRRTISSKVAMEDPPWEEPKTDPNYQVLKSF